MLGATTYPRVSPSDEVMRDVAEEMGVGHTFGHADVGVFFGTGRAGRNRARRSPTRTSAARGPRATACLHCGECMTGCRHNAKNTLVKNYLHLAEAAGVAGAPADDGDRASARGTATCPVPSGYAVDVRRTGRPGGRRTLHGRPGRRRRVGAGHPAPAAPDAAPGRPAARLPAARRALPHQLRGHPRRARPARRTPTSRAGSRSPRRSTPTRTPTSSRCATGAGRTCWRCSRRCSSTARRATDDRTLGARGPVVAPDRGRGRCARAGPCAPCTARGAGRSSRSCCW